MKFILGTVGSSDTKYEDLAKAFDTVYEHYGKDTVIDTGSGYMFKDEKNCAEAYIGRWLKESGLKPDQDVKIIDKIGLFYDENSDGERRIISAEESIDKMVARLGFMPKTVLIHALADLKTISAERYLKLADYIDNVKEIETSGFSAHLNFQDTLCWLNALEVFSKQHYAMLPYSALSDIPNIEYDENGLAHFSQTQNPYGIQVWPNPTIEAFKKAKEHNFETIIMMPHEQGKIKQVSYSPVWQNWCYRYACMNEYADNICTSSLDVSHLKEDIAITEGEWYHQTKKEGLQDKIIEESEPLGQW